MEEWNERMEWNSEIPLVAHCVYLRHKCRGTRGCLHLYHTCMVKGNEQSEQSEQSVKEGNSGGEGGRDCVLQYTAAVQPLVKYLLLSSLIFSLRCCFLSLPANCWSPVVSRPLGIHIYTA